MPDTPTPELPIPAPLWRRLAAMLYDSLLLLASYMLISGLFLGILTVSGQAPSNPSDVSEPILSPRTLQVTLFPILLLFTCSFFSYFWIRHGRTLGMQTWKISIRSTQNQPMTLQQCLIRICVAPISIFSGLGMLWMLFDKDKMTWQDRASKSQIVRVIL